MNISVAGTLQVDGVISDNGGNGSGTGGGGGSGGSIFINATSLAGSGAISANGGTGAGTIGGGGGGGRIAVISSFNTFTGTMNAAGGGGANWGGAGTIFQQQFSPSSHQLILDNAGHTGTNTLVQSLPTGNLIIRNGAIGTASSSATFASLTISSNAWMASLGPNYYNALSVTINGNATVQSGGGITADLDGSNPGIGSGPGNYYAGFLYPCSGAGHGGTGGNSVSSLALGGTAYDTVASPYSPGSGGGTYLPYSIGGNGGGEIQLTVHGTLQMDGSISANGGNGAGEGGGGASGGSTTVGGVSDTR